MSKKCFQLFVKHFFLLNFLQFINHILYKFFIKFVSLHFLITFNNEAPLKSQTDKTIRRTKMSSHNTLANVFHVPGKETFQLKTFVSHHAKPTVKKQKKIARERSSHGSRRSFTTSPHVLSHRAFSVRCPFFLFTSARTYRACHVHTYAFREPKFVYTHSYISCISHIQNTYISCC